ncbi:MAG TPA: hypothetical protein VH988_04500 [Thermoanaerobaculia bacterium]|nr:hypothetical protein [Thermoanaerobaculia bacterium]
MKARQALTLSILTLALSPAVGRAVPSPNGTPFKVSSCVTCKQTAPAVAGTAAGSTAGTFLVAWESTTPKDSLGISARIFPKTGLPKGADFLVNKDILPPQHTPAVASDPLGNYVVAWAVSSGSSLNSDVMVQRYKATGVVNGPAVMVNVDTPGASEPGVDIAPAVATAADGGFLVAWIRSVPPDAHSPGSPPAVMVRRYNKTGVPVSAPVQLSTGLVAGSQPSVCIDPTGRAVVVWSSIDEYRPFEPSLVGVSMRRVSVAGVPLDAEAVVAAPLASDSSAVVGCGAGGAFVVAWSTDQAPATSGLDIAARRFTPLAAPAGPAFRVNSTTLGEQKLPAMMTDASGNFVIVWESRLTTSNSGDSILGRRFLASGTADGADLLIYKRATQLESRSVTPRVANLGASGFVVVWAQGNANLQGRRYKLTP